VGFGATLVAEVYVNPAGEKVFLVPDAVAVTKQDESVFVSHDLSLLRG
jgi:hypothetical protein